MIAILPVYVQLVGFTVDGCSSAQAVQLIDVGGTEQLTQQPSSPRRYPRGAASRHALRSLACGWAPNRPWRVAKGQDHMDFDGQQCPTNQSRSAESYAQVKRVGSGAEREWSRVVELIGQATSSPTSSRTRPPQQQQKTHSTVHNPHPPGSDVRWIKLANITVLARMVLKQFEHIGADDQDGTRQELHRVCNPTIDCAGP